MKSSRCKSPHRSLFIILMLCAVGMFAFTFALVPIYNVFCDVTGLNGKVDINGKNALARYKLTEQEIVNRLVTVEFDVNINKELKCEIKPEHTALQIKPGALAHTSYYVKNLSDKKIIIQAIPSITPGKVAKYLKKLECFCFNQQVLNPYESANLPLRFWLEPEFPDSVHRMTLSYTLFDVTQSHKEL